MSKSIRPLTLSERKRPAQLTYVGGFKNVSFQVAELLMAPSAERNTNSATPTYAKAFLRKTANIQFPIMVPNALAVLPGMSNTVASVIGHRNSYGGYDAILVARGQERLSSLNAKLRTVEDLVKSASPEQTEEARLGKSSAARTHNQVMLAGVVVGASFEDGSNPRFHISIRQDANPNNIIPLSYEARNASAMVTRVKNGSFIYVDGEYAFRSLPAYQMDASGNVVRDTNNDPVPLTDTEGKAIKYIHTYIRITAPKDPSEFDTDFGSTPPKWVLKMAEDIAASRERTPRVVLPSNAVQDLLRADPLVVAVTAPSSVPVAAEDL